ncbi:lamin tail domain-containing protein [Parasediminibacterium sp. JCM 36343]|uniref:lamin tail domain-containing protein n=1 Tax=Parasediminibacterium sp. JCM 36343 TaxID=3374279 RepID=UPI00397E54D8
MEKIQDELVFQPLILKNTFILFVLMFWFYNPAISQISITEVYYNTPFNEMLQVNRYETKRHHLGEFIELYNYSDKDINLSDWFISGKSFKFYLPDKIIKSGQLMVVTYQSHTAYTDFLDFFQLTDHLKYSPDQVIYQSDFMLRNRYGRVSLGQRLHNTSCERVVSNLNGNVFGWGFSDEPASNFINDIAQHPADFYKVKSLQYNNSNSLIYDRPNPLSLPASVTIPTQIYDDLVSFFYQTNYAYLNYYENIANILNNSCSNSILKSSQQPSTYSYGQTPISICFNYDNAGDGTGITTNCSIVTPPGPSTNFTPDILQAISNDIIVYPNPTKNSKVSVAWKGSAIGKISSILISDYLGNCILYYPDATNISNPFSCTFTSITTSSYKALFTLTTGQAITKYILKF